MIGRFRCYPCLCIRNAYMVHGDLSFKALELGKNEVAQPFPGFEVPAYRSDLIALWITTIARDLSDLFYGTAWIKYYTIFSYKNIWTVSMSGLGRAPHAATRTHMIYIIRVSKRQNKRRSTHTTQSHMQCLLVVVFNETQSFALQMRISSADSRSDAESLDIACALQNPVSLRTDRAENAWPTEIDTECSTMAFAETANRFSVLRPICLWNAAD